MTQDFNYTRGQPVDVHAEFGVDKIGPHKYRGRKPLIRPSPDARGVFGGNLAGQALLVAIRSSPAEFKPHSLHSFFVRAANDKTPIEWQVNEVSNGKTFVNRAVKGLQDGQVVYIANISLTKRNSHREAVRKYEEYYSKIEQKAKESDGDEDDEEEEEEVEQAPPKPFVFQTPYHEWFKRHDISKLPITDIESNFLVYHKILPEFTSLKLTPEEENVSATERRLSFLCQWGINHEQGFHQPLVNVDEDYQYVGLANLSDSMYLDTLLRVLRIRDLDFNEKERPYFSVSLDHTIYFHDSDFDVTKWMGFSFKAIRFAHDRVVIEGEMYNDQGVHVATIVQEGLVKFLGRERGAKI